MFQLENILHIPNYIGYNFRISDEYGVGSINDLIIHLIEPIKLVNIEGCFSFSINKDNGRTEFYIYDTGSTTRSNNMMAKAFEPNNNWDSYLLDRIDLSFESLIDRTITTGKIIATMSGPAINNTHNNVLGFKDTSSPDYYIFAVQAGESWLKMVRTKILNGIEVDTSLRAGYTAMVSVINETTVNTQWNIRNAYSTSNCFI